MTVGPILLGALLLGVAFIVCILDVVFPDDYKTGVCFAIFLLTLIGTSIIKDSLIHSHPQAIDVYRGNTTLQITYKDSIPVDTVVVFK